MKTLASVIKKTVSKIPAYWENKLQEKFDIKSHVKNSKKELDPIILRQIYQILSQIPVQLVKDCKIKDLYLDYGMGPSLEFFPNHGFYLQSNQSITLNSNIFDAPDQPEDFIDQHGFFVNRACQTIFHEWSHALDAELGEISLKSEWLKLSGWSKDPKPGLKRLIINEAGKPPVIGEWFYNPSAEFSRFYARRNPWDDFADSLGFVLAGLQDKLPENKQQYLKRLLSKYYK